MKQISLNKNEGKLDDVEGTSSHSLGWSAKTHGDGRLRLTSLARP